ncbi:Lrp/AsnC family transcriptional regulator [Mucilaginibacter sp. BJC16-A38]|uniref:Lrp/AsnC family transcriptional regulator n=1 Tax=Mucilaginibacter phenanthrenivorans TaxID=1234842 RepID=UPI00215867AB|nr:Lrp/AsnC family transcriptional regulator [Mucilaginibacter phenanthrenivorans]MCR8556978.1 Lrp/AsnC family transcriptional regulator [Mucilaginibacter phenanthrenivorans]
MHTLDPTDVKLLQHLQQDGRISERQLAALVFKSPPAVHDRLVRLRENGYIKGYTVLLDREKIGQPVLVLTHVRLEKQTTELLNAFEEAVKLLPEVQYLLHVSGGWNFILHVTARTPQAYFTFIMEHINSLGNIGGMESCFVLRECKSGGAFVL